jgi:hypothetical protein
MAPAGRAGAAIFIGIVIALLGLVLLRQKSQFSTDDPTAPAITCGSVMSGASSDESGSDYDPERLRDFSDRERHAPLICMRGVSR